MYDTKTIPIIYLMKLQVHEQNHLKIRLIAISSSFLLGTIIMAAKFFAYHLTGSSAVPLRCPGIHPVPRELFEELSGRMKPDMKSAINDLPEEGFQQIRPKKRFDPQYFSNKEIELLKDIAFVFRDAKADAMVESTHLKNEPWDKTLHVEEDNISLIQNF